MPDTPTMFGDLPREKFPFTIEFLDAATREVVHTITVDGPAMVEVPGFRPRKVAVRTTFADGTSDTEEPPPGTWNPMSQRFE